MKLSPPHQSATINTTLIVAQINLLLTQNQSPVMKIKACLVTLALALSAALTAGAQSLTLTNGEGEKLKRISKIDTLDHSIMECVYEHTIFDPYYTTTNKYRKNPETNHKILQIGKKASIYKPYSLYLRDSIIAADYPAGITKNDYYNKLSFPLNKRYGLKGASYIFKDMTQNRLRYCGGICMDVYIYEEDIPAIDWTPTEGEASICGYRCKTATASFRGREWTAWYTEDIPIPNGPEKFGNLPGLILKIEDKKKEHVIEATQIRKSNRGFGFKKKSSAFRTDRKTYNKMEASLYNDPGNHIDGHPLTPKDSEGKSLINHDRMFFNPIEKE